MSRNYRATLAVVAGLFGAVSSADQPELCLGRFCLDGPSVYRKQFLAEHGPGCKPIIGLAQHTKSLRYYVPDQELWVWFLFESHPGRDDGDDEYRELNELLVTKEPLCQTKHIAKKAFPVFVTPKGIGVGDPIEKVKRAMGRPTRVFDSVAYEKQYEGYERDVSPLAARFGSPVLIYGYPHPSLKQWNFYTRDGIVYSISISYKE